MTPLRSVIRRSPDEGPQTTRCCDGCLDSIGYELAKCCVAEGYDLVIAADEPEIAQAASELRVFGGSVWDVEADLATRFGPNSETPASG